MKIRTLALATGTFLAVAACTGRNDAASPSAAVSSGNSDQSTASRPMDTAPAASTMGSTTGTSTTATTGNSATVSGTTADTSTTSVRATPTPTVNRGSTSGAASSADTTSSTQDPAGAPVQDTGTKPGGVAPTNLPANPPVNNR